MISPELLRRAAFFSQISEANLKALAKMAREEKYEAGNLVFREGALADKLYLIVSGQIDLVIRIENAGISAVVESLGPSDVVGWSAFVEPYRYTTSGESVLPTTLVSFDSQALRDLIAANQDLGCIIYRKVTCVMAHRLRDMRLRLTSLLPPT